MMNENLWISVKYGATGARKMYFASWTSIIYYTHALLLKMSEI